MTHADAENDIGVFVGTLDEDYLVLGFGFLEELQVLGRSVFGQPVEASRLEERDLNVFIAIFGHLYSSHSEWPLDRAHMILLSVLGTTCGEHGGAH